MAWTSITDARIDLKSPLDEDLFEDMRDNIIEVRESLVTVEFTEQTTTSGTWATLYTFDVFIPQITQQTARSRGLGVRVQAKVDSGTTGSVRLNETTAGASNTLSVTGTAYAVTSEALLQDATFDAGGIFTFTIDAQRDSGAGTVYVKSVDLVAGRVIY